jgi:hypothetical protein
LARIDSLPHPTRPDHSPFDKGRDGASMGAAMTATIRDDARARLQGRRIAHAVVITIAVAFIGASAAQIIPSVFGAQAHSIPVPAAGSPERACVDGVRSLALALDRASAQAWWPRESGAVSVGDESALQAFREGLVPEWKAEANVEQACAKSREGVEAWAALLRLRRAEEQLVLRGIGEIVPLRRDFAARLPPDLR